MDVIKDRLASSFCTVASIAFLGKAIETGKNVALPAQRAKGKQSLVQRRITQTFGETSSQKGQVARQVSETCGWFCASGFFGYLAMNAIPGEMSAPPQIEDPNSKGVLALLKNNSSPISKPITEFIDQADDFVLQGYGKEGLGSFNSYLDQFFTWLEERGVPGATWVKEHSNVFKLGVDTTTIAAALGLGYKGLEFVGGRFFSRRSSLSQATRSATALAVVTQFVPQSFHDAQPPLFELMSDPRVQQPRDLTLGETNSPAYLFTHQRIAGMDLTIGLDPTTRRVLVQNLRGERLSFTWDSLVRGFDVRIGNRDYHIQLGDGHNPLQISEGLPKTQEALVLSEPKRPSLRGKMGGNFRVRPVEVRSPDLRDVFQVRGQTPRWLFQAMAQPLDSGLYSTRVVRPLAIENDRPTEKSPEQLEVERQLLIHDESAHSRNKVAHRITATRRKIEAARESKSVRVARERVETIQFTATDPQAQFQELLGRIIPSDGDWYDTDITVIDSRGEVTKSSLSQLGFSLSRVGRNQLEERRNLLGLGSPDVFADLTVLSDMQINFLIAQKPDRAVDVEKKLQRDASVFHNSDPDLLKRLEQRKLKQEEVLANPAVEIPEISSLYQSEYGVRGLMNQVVGVSLDGYESTSEELNPQGLLTHVLVDLLTPEGDIKKYVNLDHLGFVGEHALTPEELEGLKTQVAVIKDPFSTNSNLARLSDAQVAYAISLQPKHEKAIFYKLFEERLNQPFHFEERNKSSEKVEDAPWYSYFTATVRSLLPSALDAS